MPLYTCLLWTRLVGVTRSSGAVGYQEFKVPEGFPELLRDFSREVLRDQPKDMNKYGELNCALGRNAVRQRCVTAQITRQRQRPVTRRCAYFSFVRTGYDYFMEKLKTGDAPTPAGGKK